MHVSREHTCIILLLGRHVYSQVPTKLDTRAEGFRVMYNIAVGSI